MRIVSLLPSATEIVCALGMEDFLVGVSHSCNYPHSVKQLPKLTSTRVPVESDSRAIDDYVRDHLDGHQALYDLDIETLEKVKPDVIVSQALCDVCAVATGEVDAAIAALPGNPMIVDLTPNTLDDVFSDISRVGDALDVPEMTSHLVASLEERRDRIAEISNGISEDDRPGVTFLEWLDPPFNGGHWNPELVELAGGRDLLGSPGQPSTTLEWDAVVESQPDVAFVACCGLSIDRAMEDVEVVRSADAWQSLPAVRSGRVYVADGNAYFSSPGPRLIDGLEIMAHAFHPKLFDRPAHYACRTIAPDG